MAVGASTLKILAGETLAQLMSSEHSETNQGSKNMWGYGTFKDWCVGRIILQYKMETTSQKKGERVQAKTDNTHPL